jgi:Stage II sporulation protein E (SpoIIE)/GAF domain/PAS fold
MNGSGEQQGRIPGRLAELLSEASTRVLGTAGGRVGGVYMRTGTPGLLRLAVIAGLPGQLFRPWWRLHVDRPFPVADAYRLGVQVVLPDATETMRRYPQFAAGLPFQFGSMYLPVLGETTTFGVLVVLHPAAPDTVAGLPDQDRIAQLAEDLGADLRELAGGDETAIVWEDEPLGVRPPPAARSRRGRVGRFTWDPADGTVVPDTRLRAMLELPDGGPGPGGTTGGPGGVLRAEVFAEALAPGRARQFLGALRDTAAGTPPPLPLRLYAADGTVRLVELWEGEAAPVDVAPADKDGWPQPGPVPPAPPHTPREMPLEPGFAPPSATSRAGPATPAGPGTPARTGAPAGAGLPQPEKPGPPDSATLTESGAPPPANTSTPDGTTPADGTPAGPGSVPAADAPPASGPEPPQDTGPGPPPPSGRRTRRRGRAARGGDKRGRHRSSPAPGGPMEPREPPPSGAGAVPGRGPVAAAGAPGPRVHGLVVDPGPDALGDAAADLLPDGVFCLDRAGLVRYVNQPAARLLGPAREELLGRPLWEHMPWWNRSPCDDHLRAALLSREPVHFQVRRPPEPDGAGGDWLGLSVYPGPDILSCTVAPVRRVEAPGPAEVAPTGRHLSRPPGHTVPVPGGPDVTEPVYRPIALAIALTDAVTARQVSAVVTRELLPAFGGRRLAIYLLQERHLHLAWESGFPQGFLAPFDGVSLDTRLPGVETLTSGRPMFFETMEQMTAAYPGIAVDASEGSRAFLPLIASGRPVGSCILGFEHPRRFSTEDRTVLTALAGLIAHAMERAQRYDSEAALARGLQQALLPRRLTEHPHVETAGRYLPGTEGMDVGGDWYDVVEAGDGLALVIGDVQGHGVQAAATMGQLRSAVRAFALSDQPADLVLSGTNRLMIDLDPGQFASCCYVRLDPATGAARFARAGHLPPLLRGPDGRTRVLDLPGGVVLGVDPHARYPTTELHIEYDSVLALYTDGLVERPGTDIDDGITALRVALTRAGALPGRRGGRSLSGTADRLTANARQATDRPDDVALLLAARREQPREGRR